MIGINVHVCQFLVTYTSWDFRKKNTVSIKTFLDWSFMIENKWIVICRYSYDRQSRDIKPKADFQWHIPSEILEKNAVDIKTLSK